MDGIEKLSRSSLVACDQAYQAAISNGTVLAPYPDSGAADAYPNTMPASFYDPVYVGLSGWTVFDRVDDPQTGFGATIYKRVADGKTDFMVAMQGTRGPNAQDWYGNVGFGVDRWNSDKGGQLLMAKLEALLTGTNGDRLTGDIIFTGQSLGGALAEYAAYDFRREINASGIADFPNSRIALVTFNGLGGIAGLQQISSDRGQIFDSSLLSGTTTRHYWVQGDLVSRLGEGTGALAGQNHLNGAGNAYRLDFFAESTVDGQPRWLSAVDAHRIETGFYAGINGIGSNFAFLNAQQASLTPLHVTNLAQAGAAFGNLYNSYDSARDGEATARLVATLMYGFAFGDPEEIREITRAFGESFYRSGAVSRQKYELITGTLPDMVSDLAKTPAGLNLQLRSLILASVLDALEPGATVSQSTLDALTQANALYNDTARYPANATLDAVRAGALAVFEAQFGQSDDKLRVSLAVARKLVADSIGDPALYSAIRSVTHEHLDELVTLLFEPSNSVTKFAAKLAYHALAGQTDWAVATGQLVGYLGAFVKAIGEVRGLAEATLQELAGDAANAVTSLAKGLANADADFTNDYADATTGLGEFSGWSEEHTAVTGFTGSFKSFAENLLALITGSTNAYGEELARTLKDAETLVTGAAQTLVLRPGTGANPFDAQGFDPEANPVAASNLKEGGAQSFTVYLPYEAGEAGQKVKLSLGGPAAGAFEVYADGQRLASGATGFELTVAAGERQATFTLFAAGEVAADQTLGLIAQLVDASGTPTHASHLELTLALAADNSPLRAWTGTARPDVAASVLNTELGAGERARLDGGAGADYLLGAADTVYVNDWPVTTAPVADALLGGDGADWLQGDQGADRLEGGEEADLLVGGQGADALLGGAGNDVLWALGENRYGFTPLLQGEATLTESAAFDELWELVGSRFRMLPGEPGLDAQGYLSAGYRIDFGAAASGACTGRHWQARFDAVTVSFEPTTWRYTPPAAGDAHGGTVLLTDPYGRTQTYRLETGTWANVELAPNGMPLSGEFNRGVAGLSRSDADKIAVVANDAWAREAA